MRSLWRELCRVYAVMNRRGVMTFPLNSPFVFGAIQGLAAAMLIIFLARGYPH